MIREIQNRPSPGKGLKPFDPILFALRRGWIIGIVGLVLFLFLSPMAFFLDKPWYTTGGSLLINPEMKQFFAKEEDTIAGNFNDYARTQVNRLQTDDVLMEALRNLPPEQWPAVISPAMDLQTAATILRTQLEVSQVSRTHLLRLHIGGPSPDGLAPALNAIMDAYIEKLQTEQETGSVRRLTYLQDEKNRLKGMIAEQKDALNRLSEQLNSSTFNDFLNVYMTKYNLVQENYLRAEKSALDAKSILEKAERDRTLLTQQSLEVFARESVEKNEALYLINNWTYQELQKLRKTIDGLTETNPDRIVVEERMNAMREYLDTFQNDIYTNSLDILQEKRGNELEVEVIRAQSAFQAAEHLSLQLEERLTSAQAEFESSSGLISSGKEIEEDLNQLRLRLAKIQERISEVFLEAKAPVRVSIEERSKTPGKPVEGSLAKFLAVCFIFSMGVTGAGMLAYDILDGRIHQSGELKAAIGGKPLEPIQVYPEPLRFANCVANGSKHPIAQYLKNIAVRLNNEREKHNSQVFLFTGTEHEAGTTSIAQNIASAFGVYTDRVLRIKIEDKAEDENADFGEDHILQFLHQLNRTGNSRYAECNLSSVYIEQLKRSVLELFITKARESWDVIIFDCPPLLNSDLTQFIALHVDAAIIITREAQTLYADLFKSFEFLIQANVPAVSAILNRASDHPLVTLIKVKNSVVERLSDYFHRYIRRDHRETVIARSREETLRGLSNTRTPFA